jgi:metallo-beta-lactamase class B
MHARPIAACVLVAFLAGAPGPRAQSNDWLEPFAPFRIAGNLYYVGSRGLASYLVTTSEGHVLINSSLEASVPLIRASVEKLGFKFADVKVLLISHAHWDHNAGSAAIKTITGAKYMVMDADVAVVESGGKADFQYGSTPSSQYPATNVDRVLHDGDEVKLGDAVLVAHLTPGHTKGCTTWTMKVQEVGRARDVVIVGSPNVNAGYKLVNNAAYPQIADDYERMFRVLKSLPIDIFLGAHGSYFDMEAKYARMNTATASPFIDPDGYKKFIAEREQAYRTELAKQRGRYGAGNDVATTCLRLAHDHSFAGCVRRGIRTNAFHSRVRRSRPCGAVPLVRKPRTGRAVVCMMPFVATVLITAAAALSR